MSMVRRTRDLAGGARGCHQKKRCFGSLTLSVGACLKKRGVHIEEPENLAVENPAVCQLVET